jgi:signal transduction histidine kinase/DNA-binding response OmpR family regulator
MFGSYAALNTIVRPTYQEFEQQSAEQNLQRVERAIEAEFQALTVMNREYSEWDHTYAYAQGLRDEYVAENLDVSFWSNIDVSLMAYFNLDGEQLWAAMLDPSGSEELAVDETLTEPFGPDHPLVELRNRTGLIYGYLETESGLMLVASLPILTSIAEGPPVGALIVGKYLDPARINRLVNRTNVHAALFSIGDLPAGSILTPITDATPGVGDSVQWQRRDGELVGYRALFDVFGEPGHVLEVSTPRTITAIGNGSVNLTISIFVAATIIFLFVAWVFMRKDILAPIQKLTVHIKDMSSNGNLHEPCTVDRQDEIGVLAQSFSSLAVKLGDARQELEGARDKALAVSDAKSRFLARMSHEIRTPLNGVLGMVELLSRTPLTRGQKLYSRSIQESGEALLEITEDVLDFSKIESGKLALNTRPFHLRTLLTAICDSVYGLAEHKGLLLRCLLPDNASLIVERDPVRLRQVLMNLLGNAIKFTDKGSVTLRAFAQDTQDDYVDVMFEVSDTGIGIAPRKQRKIFDPFVQEDGSTTRRFGGTGLGLSICKELVELMGSRIHLQSRPGQGSVFSFTLRMKSCVEEAVDETGSGFGSRYRVAPDTVTIGNALQGRVLVAEDNPINQAVAVGMLEAIGIEACVARDGREALDKYQSEPFDAILMDCQMPVLDGYQATEEIRRRESGSGAATLPVIAVTANALPTDIQKCISVGMDDYLCKPLTIAQLYLTLARFLPEVDSAESDTGHAASTRQDKSDVQASDADQAGPKLIRQSLALDELQIERQSLGFYLSDSRELMAKLGSAMDNSDADYVRQTARALRISSRNVGAAPLADLFGRLEKLTRQADEHRAKSLLEQIQEEYASVVEEFKYRLESPAA